MLNLCLLRFALALPLPLSWLHLVDGSSGGFFAPGEAIQLSKNNPRKANTSTGFPAFRASNGRAGLLVRFQSFEVERLGATGAGMGQGLWRKLISQGVDKAMNSDESIGCLGVWLCSLSTTTNTSPTPYGRCADQSRGPESRCVASYACQRG